MRRNLIAIFTLIALAIAMVYLVPQGMSIYNGMSALQWHSVLWGVFYGSLIGGTRFILWQDADSKSTAEDKSRAQVLNVLLVIISSILFVLSASFLCLVGKMERTVLELSNFAFLVVPLLGIATISDALRSCVRGYLERKKHSSGAVA